ncbi:hypothetical protein KR009_001524 [Drosophila setifemur]|nr:hypothetical protein KR009_001524 [Drosophila setifemur]
MPDPTDEMLDRHFRQQMAKFWDVDQQKATDTDGRKMAKWIRVFEAAPLNQKLARNGLMMLMHAQMEEFGHLKPPFTDVRNCGRDLNEVLDSYQGISSGKEPSKRVSSRTSLKEPQPLKEQHRLVAGRSLSHRRTSGYCLRSQIVAQKLDPITEVTEPSELEPTTSSLTTQVTVIRREFFRAKSSGESSNSQRTCLCSSRSSERLTVRQRIQSIERQFSPKESPPKNTNSVENIRRLSRRSRDPRCVQLMIRRDSSSSSNSQEQISKRTKILGQITGKSSAVRNLKNCFEEMAERLKESAEEEQKSSPGIIKQKDSPPGIQKSSEEETSSMPRLYGGKCQPSQFRLPKCIVIDKDSSSPDPHQNGSLESMLKRQEELRRECSKYYNADANGTLKDFKDGLQIPESKIRGFQIGATKAMEQLNSWRGAPNTLNFFTTCFDISDSDMDSEEWKALDKELEDELLDLWFRKSVSKQLKNRRSKAKIQPSAEQEDITLPPSSKDIDLEHLAHLAEIKELCETHGTGKMQPEALNKILSALEDKLNRVARDLDGYQQDQEEEQELPK